MYEKSKKKCAFLREVSRLTSARGIVINQEFHANHSDLPASIDVVCARAVAPLAKLLELTQPIIARGALGLFPKGQNVDAEVTEATRYWKFDLEMRQSLVDKQSTVVAVRSLEPRSDEQT